MTHCCCFFLLYNTTIEEDDNTLPSSSCSQTQRRQNTQKNNKKKGGNLFSSFHSALSLLAPTFALLFQTLSPSTFFFSSKRKEKKCREGKELSFKLLLYPFTLCSCFCPLASTCLFQTLSHGIFFFLNRLKKNKEKKTIEKKNAEKGRSSPSSSHLALSLLAPASTLLFLPFCFKHLLLCIFFLKQKEKTP